MIPYPSFLRAFSAWCDTLRAQWEWRKPSPGPRPFLFLSEARSGSTMLRTALQQHPDIFLEDEAFYAVAKPDLRQQDLPIERDILLRHPERAAVHLWALGRQRQVSGFTLFSDQMRGRDQERLWRFLARWPSLPVLHLQRRNRFLQWLSLREAQALNIWHARQNETLQERAPIHLNPDHYLPWLDYMTKADAFALQQLGHQPRHHLYYEDLVADFAKQTSMIMQFLGVKDFDVESETRKTGVRPVKERLANWPAFVERLAGTPAAKDLEEALGNG